MNSCAHHSGAQCPPTFTMLPTIIFGKKYCRSSQRAQQEIQEQSSNTDEQADRFRTKYEYCMSIIK